MSRSPTADPCSARATRPPACCLRLPVQVTATNKGNIKLLNAFIGKGSGNIDALDANKDALACGGAGVELPPQASISCVMTFQTTQEDVDAGQLVNAATASARVPEWASASKCCSVETKESAAANQSHVLNLDFAPEPFISQLSQPGKPSLDSFTYDTVLLYL